MAKDIPLPQVLAQEPTLVLPPQRPPQPGCTWPQCVDPLPPIRTGFARMRDPRECGAQLLKRASAASASRLGNFVGAPVARNRRGSAP